MARKYRENHIPIDMVLWILTTMDNYKDFTVNEEFEIPAVRREPEEDHIRLVPIIDAGVKIEEGYDAVKGRRREELFL